MMPRSAAVIGGRARCIGKLQRRIDETEGECCRAELVGNDEAARIDRGDTDHQTGKAGAGEAPPARHHGQACRRH